MGALDIDRLHVRYGMAPEVAAEVDRTVSPLLVGRLAAVVLDSGPDQPEAAFAHVCVPELEVSVRLDTDRPAHEHADRWADAIVTALHARLQQPDVVAYPRHLDALLDAVIGVARGDLHRTWAWRQAGVVRDGRDPTRTDDLVAALAATPSLIPAVLRAAAARVRLDFSADGWVRLARAWQTVSAGRSSPPAPSGRAGVPDPPPDPVPHPSDAAAAVRTAASALARQVPSEVWRRPGASDVARLLVACHAPAQLGRASVPQTIVAYLRAGSAAPPATGTSAAPPRRPLPDAAGATQSVTPVDAASTAAADATPAAVPSAWAGILLAVRVLDGIDLALQIAEPAHPLHPFGVPWVLAHLAARLTGAPPSDPAALALAGLDPTVDDRVDVVAAQDLSARAAGTLDNLVAAVAAAHRRLLDLSATADLTWIWRRQGLLRCDPGWIEVTYRLDDVDLRLRKAGVDLDPGWVWWLGAVVRYRYA